MVGPLHAGTIEAVSALLRESGTPGASVAVRAGNGADAAAGVGTADLPGASPMPADARFSLYSVTKLILATAAMRLVDAGRLALDDPVADLLPDAPLPAGITLRHLLGHTSGLPDYGALPAYAADLRRDPQSPWTDDDFLDRTLAQGMVFPPGEGWAYSNIGYLLVRRIVERVAGLGSLQAALATLVFQPLGLSCARVATSLADTAALTPGYSRQLGGGDLSDIRRRYHPGWVSHGTVTATAAETARIVGALFDGELLSPPSLAAMVDARPVGGTHPPFRSPGYGLGLMVDLDREAYLVAGHAGGGPGYATAAFRFETEDGRRLTSVALANRDGGDVAVRVAFAAARIALRLPE